MSDYVVQLRRRDRKSRDAKMAAGFVYGPRWLRVFLSNNRFEERHVIRLGIHGDSAATNRRQAGTGSDVRSARDRR